MKNSDRICEEERAMKGVVFILNEMTTVRDLYVAGRRLHTSLNDNCSVLFRDRAVIVIEEEG